MQVRVTKIFKPASQKSPKYYGMVCIIIQNTQHLYIFCLSATSKVCLFCRQRLNMKSSQIFSSSSDEPADERRVRKQKRGRGAADQYDRDFGAFLLQFPATASSSPPTKKKRTAAGFPSDKVFYNRWRSMQFAKREEYLSCKLMCFIIKK